MTDYRKSIFALVDAGSHNARGTYEIYRARYPNASKYHQRGVGAGRYNAVQNALIWLMKNGYVKMFTMERKWNMWYRAEVTP